MTSNNDEHVESEQVEEVERVEQREQVEPVEPVEPSRVAEHVVTASSVDSVHIKFECPYCWDRYKKDGSPYKRAKRNIHQHGSSGDLTYRQVHRVAHCGAKGRPDAFVINIDSSTEGAVPLKSNATIPPSLRGKHEKGVMRS